ncbi:hypothetical protein BO226_25745 (plasmid) [Rhodococcus sp. 2G]|uniref:NACHT domain-containing protein n=1 Tax=Rhodococcus sp. 2G TaxID=1570939 RepID=UPI00090317D0|nr:NACHT domain-containing protein [Rhodococcus sp. 2G]APE12746.1 hypothetical protein BO226_25745 [Rhodococcus sp. 2G]
MAGDAGQSGRYLYNRLSEKQFQQLCNSLLAHSFPEMTCYPVGHSDGGRDAVRRTGRRSVVYQVKWTSKPLQSPLSWLTEAIRGEADDIRRLVEEGAEEYYLMTSVAGTAVPLRGTMDKLDKRLEEYSAEFGIPMHCWWQADIDARVDAAPAELKWTYQEMLAGVDAVRYLREADSLAAKDQELRTLLLAVLATQWQEDVKVKFKQAELEAHRLTDLFIDVEAVQVSQPGRAGMLSHLKSSEALGGAAAYLLATKKPLTLVRGEPGQGKSTLGQYLCQVHRAAFLPDDGYRPGDTHLPTPQLPRLPLRLDLRDYAAWLGGEDPFSDFDEDPRKKARRARKQGSLEVYLAEFLSARSGGLSATVEMVRDVLLRFPMLIVLDGLDEMAQIQTRTRAVKEIDQFAARLGVNSLNVPQVVVTTRPNASGMAEPSMDTFEAIALTRLSPSLRTEYLRKWAEAHSIRGRDRRDLERTFRQRSAEPHIVQLADNPMQLTILLYLMRKRGNSVPAARTELYTSYMETFLDREAAKTPAVDEYRVDLEEVTAYLGWHLQSLAESAGRNGQLATKALRKAILDYLFGVEKQVDLVDALFTAVTDRVWALTSKVQGTFEFDVQPLREYFAARFLNDFAGADVRAFDKSTVLRALVRRPYWLNTSRFYAGFAKPNELAGLVEALEEELEEGVRPLQVRLAAWMLLADGVFSARTRTQRNAVDLISDDLSVRLLAHTLVSDSETPVLAPDRGGEELAERLKEQLASDPDSALTFERVAIVKQLQDRETFNSWWQARLFADSGRRQVAWLQLGASVKAGVNVAPDGVAKLELSENSAVVAAVGAGIMPDHGSPLEDRMIQAVLDGQCSESEGAGWSIAADLLKLCAPQHHLRRAFEDEQAYQADVGHRDTPVSGSTRQTAMRRLKERDSRFDHLQRALRFNKGQSGTSSPWGNTARALSDIYGPCWLAAEIAIIGASLPTDRFRTGVDITPGSEPFGEAADYGRLLQDIRFNRSKPEWWAEKFVAHDDPLSRATWALALLAGATDKVVLSNLSNLDTVAETLSDRLFRTMVEASSRLGASGLTRRLADGVLAAGVDISPVIGLLVAHHATAVERPADLPQFTTQALGDVGKYGTSGWPALRALSMRMIASPSEEVLEGIRAHGAASVLPSLAIPRATVYDSGILCSPADFPLEWVLAAERRVSQDAGNEPLEQVAADNEWFTL